MFVENWANGEILANLWVKRKDDIGEGSITASIFKVWSVDFDAGHAARELGDGQIDGDGEAGHDYFTAQSKEFVDIIELHLDIALPPEPRIAHVQDCKIKVRR